MGYFAHETAVIDAGANIGDGTRVWHFTHIMKDASIGSNCTIGQNVFIASNVRIGDNTKIQNNVSVFEGVTCEENVFIGPSVVFTNITNPRSEVSRKGEYKKTLVRNGATIGANATILCGIEIGSYAFIGAGAVVTSSVLPYAVVVGNPARQSGWMSEKGHALEFDKNGTATCKQSGEIYMLLKGKVTKKTLNI